GGEGNEKREGGQVLISGMYQSGMYQGTTTDGHLGNTTIRAFSDTIPRLNNETPDTSRRAPATPARLRSLGRATHASEDQGTASPLAWPWLASSTTLAV